MPDVREHGAHAGEHGVRYEPRDVGVAGIIAFAFAVLCLLIVACLAMVWLLNAFARYYHVPRPQVSVLGVPEPAMHPGLQRLELREYEDRLLYGPPGVQPEEPQRARIPIDRAMELVLERGLPPGGGDPPGGATRSEPEPGVQP